MNTVPNDKLLSLLNLPPVAISERVAQKLIWCQRRVEEVYGVRVPIPCVKYDLRGSTAGQAWGTELIRMNLDILLNPDYTDHMIDNTLVHEFAHTACNYIYPNPPHHGYEWQRMMIRLGLAPERTHNYKTKPARQRKKYAYVCGCHERIRMIGSTRHKRIQNGTYGYSCTVCNQKLEWMGE